MKLFSNTISRISIILFACLMNFAHADETIENVPVIEVKGARALEWKSYRQLVKALDVFEVKKSLAPLAQPHFKVISKGEDLNLDSISLKLTADEIDIDLHIESDGSFDLPYNKSAIDNNAQLTLSKTRHALGWWPSIISPGTSPYSRRLGDLRMECEMVWAVEQDSAPFIIRNMFRLAGGPCHSSRIGMTFPSVRPLMGIRLHDGDRVESWPIKKGSYSFQLPLHDKAWSNETLIEFLVEP